MVILLFVVHPIAGKSENLQGEVGGGNVLGFEAACLSLA